jgi:hypothetical protein
MDERPADDLESIDAAPVSVTPAGVRTRGRSAPRGGPWLTLAMTAMVIAVVVGGLALRNAAAENGQAALASGPSPSDVGPLVSPTPTQAATAETQPTTSIAPDPTAAPTIEPTLAHTISPTKKPPKPNPTYPEGGTDHPFTEWTPPPGFTGTLTVSDHCAHANGTEEVLIELVFHTPTEISDIEFFLNGNSVGMGGPPAGQEVDGTVSLGRDVEVGMTVVATAHVLHGPLLVDLIATVVSDAFLVPQGEPCPGG